MTTTTVQENLKAYLLENTDELRQLVNELNSWDGILEHLQAYENDEDFFEMFFSGKMIEAVRATQFGDYRYSDDLVRFNGYANLDSFSEYTYIEELKDSIEEIIELVIEKQQHLSLDSDIEEILEAEEEEEE